MGLIADVNDMRDDDRPVEVILLRMGPNVDDTAMGRIAEATGGRYVQVDKAEDMPDILVGIVAARAEG